LQQPSAPNDIAAKAQSTAASVGCPGCHLAYFQGDGTTARLAGQWQDYLNKTIPVIWGQNEGYLIYQLRDFKSGRRKNDLMSPIAAAIDQADINPLAAYFSGLKWPDLQQPSAPNDIAAKAQSTAASVGCPGCHLAYFQGDGTTARLAGQWQDYLNKTMTDFRTSARGNNPGMSDLMKATSPDDLAALAQYLAGLQIDAYLNQGR
jgi:cytochrome c553